MTKQFLKIIQEDPEITKYFKDAVCKAFCHIYESAATDVNQMQIAADPGSVAPGTENGEQVATSNDPIVNELLQNSAAAKGGCRVSLSLPGRTSLGIMGWQRCFKWSKLRNQGQWCRWPKCLCRLY